ncbi:PREDICTED: uncharacterized protein K02A2.6-like [Trachymyrmex cornetzi]|uniref:uncharacterized protein K02A2.6-like n=1 Tax=Trachymyrmex cornetzi TaxID=471704 RepID=UPI00084F860B|nr:PREDICTED: uncharacterized protein K02A2.6-like [Trachymyrmex cornetzi]
MAGGIKFTKIDLQQAYLQLGIQEADRDLLTLNTHKGLFRCTRLMFGVASAPAIWQRVMENLLQDIPGVSVFLDDIRVTGPDDETHLHRVELVLQRLADANIRINESKSEFMKDSIHYCGYKIDKNGVHKSADKMDAIDQMPRPSNISELRSFLGMINYYGRFIKNLSTILAPLHVLLQKGVVFKWTRECEQAFQLAKENFKSNMILAHFDSRLPLILATDASPYGDLPVSMESLARATQEDVQLKKIINALCGKKEVPAKLRFNINQASCSIQKDILFCNGKVVIPHSLRDRLLKELHKSHFDIVKIKALARSLFWWPGLDKSIEKLAENCSICNTYRNDPPKVEVHEWEPTKAPFERVHVDYAGPFMGTYFFLMVDAFSKWPFVFVMKDITARSTIEKCKEIFMNFGCPEIMVMDNGRSFRSSEFLQFLANNNITPKFTAAYHPATNGQVERFVQTMKNSLQKMCAEARNKKIVLEEILRDFLIQYRVTPHCVTGVAPAELGRTLQIAMQDRKSGNSQLEDGRVWERHVDQILGSKESGVHPENSYNQLDSGESEIPGMPDQETTSQEENHTNETSAEPNERQPSPAVETSTPELAGGRQKELPARRRVPPAWVADFWMGQPRK